MLGGISGVGRIWCEGDMNPSAETETPNASTAWVKNGEGVGRGYPLTAD